MSQLASLFRTCFLNTLETTVKLLADGSTFVSTGDIPAMWLRDSSAQVEPYVRQAPDDPDVRRLVAGVIKRQAAYLAVDPYANAFNETANGAGHQTDRTRMHALIWERKWELDSVCYPIRLCMRYWEATGDETIFDGAVHRMLRVVVDTMRTEQRHERSAYRFERDGGRGRETLPFGGRGSPAAYTGMVWSGFRPSDDACTYGYLVPANMFAVVALGYLAEFAERFYADEQLVEDARRLRGEIERGIQTHGIVEHKRHGRIYAYEADGLGHHNLMDDANVPSLLSIPYLGYRPSDDAVYRNTRAFALSADNPYYFRGRYAEGVGSPHTPPGYVWPIGLAIQGLTSVDRDERERLLSMLAETTAGTGYMHESFDPDRPEAYTRPWFGWANSLFAEFVLSSIEGDRT